MPHTLTDPGPTGAPAPAAVPARTAAPTVPPAPTTAPSPAADRPPPVRLVCGLKPTGRLHLGNYLGAIAPLVALASDPGHVATVFVADLHALTVDHDPAVLAERTSELAATLLACGLDERTTVFVQSRVSAHTDLAYLLECTAGVGELTRMIQFRQAADGGANARLSLLSYPVLMAADVLVHRADAVTVGDDQRQHLELTRTLAQRFNTRYGTVFTVPRALTPGPAARVRDLRDPRAKMGKSDSARSGLIHLLDEPHRIAAAVRAAVTDLDPVLGYDPQLRPGIADLADLLAALTGRTPTDVLAGVHGAGRLKAVLTDALVDRLRPIRDRYREIVADPGELDRVLADGARRAGESAAPTLAAARRVMGL